MSLDQMGEILSWSPAAEFDPLRLWVQVQVMRAVLMIGARYELEASCERQREGTLFAGASECRKAGEIYTLQTQQLGLVGMAGDGPNCRCDQNHRFADSDADQPALELR